MCGAEVGLVIKYNGENEAIRVYVRSRRRYSMPLSVWVVKQFAYMCGAEVQARMLYKYSVMKQFAYMCGAEGAPI